MKTRKSFDMALGGLLVVFDFVGVYLAYVFSFYIYRKYFGNPPQTFEEILKLATIPAGLSVASFFLTSVYRCQPGPLGLDQLRRLLSSYFWGGLIAFSLTFFTKTQGFSRIMVTMGFILGIFFALMGRAIFVRMTAPIRSSYRLNRRVLILGAGKVGKTLARNLLTTGGQHEITGFLDDQFPSLTEVTIKIGERSRWSFRSREDLQRAESQ
jgi:FlaA1/EpsC-like NDP-sugar epimerase